MRWFIIALLMLLSNTPAAQEFRALAQDDLLYLHLDTGVVVVELNAQYAPRTVAQIRMLAGAGFYNGRSFYRVIDGFVAQGGVGEDESNAQAAILPLESFRALSAKEPVTIVQSPDMFAPHTAFWRGFAIGLSQNKRNSWLLHCPGAIGMSRANEPDTATSDFYIVIGQAPRYLDSIMTIFGRVVWGMDSVQKIIRAHPTSSGIIAKDQPQTLIRWAAIGSGLPKEQQLALAVEMTEGQAFEDKLKDRRARPQAFFFRKPPAVLDACQVPIGIQLR